MKNCVFIFEKDILFTRNKVFLLNRSKFLKVPTQQSLLFFSEILRIRSSLRCLQESLKSIFSELVYLRKQNKNKTKKIHTQVFRHCYVQYLRKISRKNNKPCFRWSSSKSLFFKQKTLFFAKNRSLSKVTHQYFSIQNQYNQTITKFVLKSDIQDIHRP